MMSECCGAEIIYTDLCSACKEHCEAVPETDEEAKENGIA